MILVSVLPITIDSVDVLVDLVTTSNGYNGGNGYANTIFINHVKDAIDFRQKEYYKNRFDKK